MIRYQVFRKRNKAIWLEVENPGDSWGRLVEEARNNQGEWVGSAIRVPVEGLRNAVSKVTIRHEVAT